MKTIWLRTCYEISFEISVPTPFIFMIRPKNNSEQWVKKESLNLDPHFQITEFTDHFGNLCQKFVAEPTQFTIQAKAEVNTQKFTKVDLDASFIEVQHLPHTVLKYLLPSRYCESDRFSDLANMITRNQNPGYAQVQAIEDWLRNTILFLPGSSDFAISAIEVNQRQSGVCRDLAHLGIALCRSLCIPARIVVGLKHKLKPMDMHAWFEAYVGGNWYTFDATQQEAKGGYIAIGYGRDAADVVVFNQFGPLAYSFNQKISIEEI